MKKIFVLWLLIAVLVISGCNIKVTPTEVVPQAPTNLQAAGTSTTTIVLTWNDVANETGYRIYRGSTATTVTSMIAGVGAGVTTYTDTGLQPGTTYYYQVKAYNNVGESVGSSLVNARTEEEVIPTVPAAPSNLAAAADGTQIMLQWNDNSTDEAGFRIYRGATGTTITNLVSQVGVGVTTFTDSGLSYGTTYYYQVKAYNNVGESAASNTAQAITEEEVIPVVPAAPVNLAAAATGTAITLTWSDSAADEQGFTIYRGTTGTQVSTQIAQVQANVTAYTDAGLAYGTTYYYQVKAYNAVGESTGSNIASAATEAEVIPTVPANPANLTAAANGTAITLNWSDNSLDETGFKLYRGNSSTTVNELVTTVAAGVQTYTDSGLAYATTYYYQVKAYNAVGESSGSNLAQATTIPEPTPPAAPAQLQAVAGAGPSVNLTWLDQSTDETGFRIYRGTTGTSINELIQDVAAGVTAYTDTDVSYSTTYYYQVKAYNVNGESTGSNTVNVTTGPEPVPPAAPSNLSAVASGTTITLNWSDNSADEQGFKIYRGTAGTAMALIKTCGSGVTSYVDSGLQYGTTYYYEVTAYNAIGESAASNQAEARTIPAAPSNLTAEAVSTSGITLSWQDNSSGESGFKIYRGASATTVNTLLTEVGPGVVTFTDEGLSWGTTYYYLVKVYNQTGSSAASNVASATTLIPPTTATGQIVDQYGQGIAGMLVQLGQQQVQTDATGGFTLTGLQAGSNQLSGKGGTAAHYLMAKTITLEVGENQLGQLTAYQEMGVGVIIQSAGSQTASLSQTASAGVLSRMVKEVDFSGTWVNPYRDQQPVRRTGYRPTSFGGLQNNLAFIYLQWEPFNDAGAVSYKIYFRGTGGTQKEAVWNSTDAHPEDPEFMPSYPAAYLDLSNELAYKITTPGEYYFTIEATSESNGSTQTVSLPMILVSLGMALDNYPTNLVCSGTALSWTGVTGAQGYRVRIYDETDFRVYDSGPELLTTTSTGVPQDLISGMYYSWMVDAQALDATGWPKELTRAISAFVH